MTIEAMSKPVSDHPLCDKYVADHPIAEFPYRIDWPDALIFRNDDDARTILLWHLQEKGVIGPAVTKIHIRAVLDRKERPSDELLSTLGLVRRKPGDVEVDESADDPRLWPDGTVLTEADQEEIHSCIREAMPQVAQRICKGGWMADSDWNLYCTILDGITTVRQREASEEDMPLVFFAGAIWAERKHNRKAL